MNCPQQKCYYLPHAVDIGIIYFCIILLQYNIHIIDYSAPSRFRRCTAKENLSRPSMFCRNECCKCISAVVREDNWSLKTTADLTYMRENI